MTSSSEDADSGKSPAQRGASSGRRVVAVVLAVVVVLGVGGTIALTTGEGSSSGGVADTDAATTTTAIPEDTDSDGLPDATDPDPYSDDTSDLDSAPDSTETTDSSSDESDSSSTPTENVAVGELARDDGLTFRVSSLEPVASIPRDYEDPITPKKGAKLVLARVTVKNNTSTGVDPFCGENGAILLDQEDRNFEMSSDSIGIPGNDICGDSLAPGFKKRYQLVFEMPADAKTSGLALWNNDDDEDSSGDTYVLVSK